MEDKNLNKTDELQKTNQNTQQEIPGNSDRNNQESPYGEGNELGSSSGRGAGAGQNKRGSF